MKIERVIDPVPSTPYPTLIDGDGACPPEDVGGPWGYGDFIDAINNPNHECHAELTE